VKGTRSNLFQEAIRVIAEMREATHGKYPRYAVWENVRGALVSRQGKDFRAAMGALADVGALDVAWRVVNTANYGPPQRRLRVFVVADFGGERAGEVLAHPARVLWYPPTGNEKGTDTTGRTRRSVAVGQWRGTRDVTSSILGDSGGVCVPEAQAGMLVYSKSKRPKHADDYETWKLGVVAPTLNLFDNTCATRATAAVIEPGYRVRRLTPRECERIQGWPDDHTRYTDTGDELADSPRYRMIGNGVSAPVAQWIGENLRRTL
jgi:DNA (cytosine-5)-methyltransferase 1